MCLHSLAMSERCKSFFGSSSINDRSIKKIEINKWKEKWNALTTGCLENMKVNDVVSHNTIPCVAGYSLNK